MQTQVVLNLPDDLYQSAEQLAAGMKRPVQSVLTDMLLTALGVWGKIETPIHLWSDERVLDASDSQMSNGQSERMTELLDKQQRGELTADEKPELWALMRIYEVGQLRKAKALAESVRRGIRTAGIA